MTGAQKIGVAVLVFLAFVTLMTITQGQSCESKAEAEYDDMKQAEIDGGGELGGFVDHIDARHAYAMSVCGDES